MKLEGSELALVLAARTLLALAAGVSKMFGPVLLLVEDPYD